jgi:hypothetical protein
MAQIETTQDWIPGKINASEKSMYDYAYGLNITRYDLNGRILDLGSGLTQQFNTDMHSLCEREGIPEPEVFSLSPDVVSKRYRSKLIASSGFENRTVAGLGQMLPFLENVFRSIFAVGSLTNYAGFEGNVQATSEVVTIWMGELIRTLEPGGSAKLAGIYDPETHDMYQEAFKPLGALATIEIQPIFLPTGEPLITPEDVPRQIHRMVIQKVAE